MSLDVPKLSLSVLRDEVRGAADNWLLMADHKQKTRFGRHFEIHQEAISRDASRSSKSGMTLGELEESELELQKKNWVSQYQTFFGGGQEAPAQVQAVNRQKKVEATHKYIKTLCHPDCIPIVMKYLDGISGSDSALAEFLVVCRSLSISTEQGRNKSRSVYKSSYPVWPIDRSQTPASEELLRSSTKPKPVKKTATTTTAAHHQAEQTKPKENDDILQTKKFQAPKADKNLLHWAGDVMGANSRYRDDYKAHHQRYASIIPAVQRVSDACNRLIPDAELPISVTRPVNAQLACTKQSRFLLKQGRPAPQPSWHLLYKDGVSFTVGQRHDPGETSLYRMDFAGKSSVVKPALPAIDPFESNIKIKMSDFKYFNTTYHDTIETSADWKNLNATK